MGGSPKVKCDHLNALKFGNIRYDSIISDEYITNFALLLETGGKCYSQEKPAEKLMAYRDAQPCVGAVKVQWQHWHPAEFVDWVEALIVLQGRVSKGYPPLLFEPLKPTKHWGMNIDFPEQSREGIQVLTPLVVKWKEGSTVEASVATDVSSKLLFKGLDAYDPDAEKAAFVPDPKLPKLRFKHSGLWSCSCSMLAAIDETPSSAEGK
ncbi:uncharacterized protein G2W53_002706 [Senna tora]|uniref:Uncharacterized protein n=1 Tax=Senna tora TaxID=362788 RepID=A0A834X9S8_9FABA|nr:uncharacterized protein G2W53_002706 [Senna tora]